MVLKRSLVQADEVLGRIPRPEELRQELESIEKEMARETEES